MSVSTTPGLAPNPTVTATPSVDSINETRAPSSMTGRAGAPSVPPPVSVGTITSTSPAASSS
ncbi:hypothetical protein D3C83_311980 [compost metagenome]